MPLISRFFGIFIYMYQEINSKHKEPHFHAYYSEYEAVFDLQGTLLVGEMPTRQKKLIEAWVLIHEAELIFEWKSLIEFGTTFPIKGLE